MAKSHYKISIGGKFQSPPAADCLMSSAESPWSGFLIEHHRLSASYFDRVVCAPKPMLAFVTSGEPLARWHARGSWHTAQWRPGLMTLWDRDYPLDQVSFSTPYEALLIELDDTKHVEWVHDDFDRKPHLRPHVMTEDAHARFLAQSMQQEIAGGCKSGRLYSQSLSLALMSYIWGRYACEPPPSLCTPSGLSSSRLRLLHGFIQDNLSNDITLNDLAALAQLSARQLLRNFKQATGLSPHQYMLRERIEKAKAMLAADEQSVTEIALSLGFSSQSHFTDTFRKQTGTSPRRFAKQS